MIVPSLSVIILRSQSTFLAMGGVTHSINVSGGIDSSSMRVG